MHHRQIIAPVIAAAEVIGCVVAYLRLPVPPPAYVVSEGPGNATTYSVDGAFTVPLIAPAGGSAELNLHGTSEPGGVSVSLMLRFRSPDRVELESPAPALLMVGGRRVEARGGGVCLADDTATVAQPFDVHVFLIAEGSTVAAAMGAGDVEAQVSGVRWAFTPGLKDAVRRLVGYMQRAT